MDIPWDRIPRPMHAGRILRLYLEERQIRPSAFADHLRVSRSRMYRLVNGRSKLSVNMALRIAKATGTSPNEWVELQRTYELWEAHRNLRASGFFERQT